jgi:hypothetical protein
MARCSFDGCGARSFRKSFAERISDKLILGFER